MSDRFQDTTMKQLRSVLVRWAILLMLLGAFAMWASCRMTTAASRLQASGDSGGHDTASTKPEIEYCTCTMHAEVQQPEPGECPICGMKLVPKYVGSDEPDVKPKMAAHPAAKPQAPTTQAWYRCTMPECGDQGSDDPNSECPVCGMTRERVDMGGGDVGDLDISLSERARQLAEVETAVVGQRLLYKRIRTVGRVGYDETRYKMVSAWIGGRIDKLFADFTGMTVTEGDHLVVLYFLER